MMTKYSANMTINGRSAVDDELGIQTRDHRMVGVDESDEVWKPPYLDLLFEVVFRFSTTITIMIKSDHVCYREIDVDFQGRYGKPNYSIKVNLSITASFNTLT